MNETLDEEVDYGSCGSSANPLTDSDHAWSTPENEGKDKFAVHEGNVNLESLNLEFSSQYINFNH